MPFKDRFRRVIRSDRSGSGSSSSNSNSNSESRVQTATNTPGTSGAATPNPSHRNSTANTPTITLTKTNTNRLSLSKTLTWTRDKKSKDEKLAEKQQKRLDYWEQKDRLEWTTPEDGWRRSGKKRSKQHQDMLRAFEFDFSARRKSVSSWISGISPGQSRVGSVVDGDAPGKMRKRSSGAGMAGSTLSRQVTREDQEDGEGPLGHAISTVTGV